MRGSVSLLRWLRNGRHAQVCECRASAQGIAIDEALNTWNPAAVGELPEQPRALRVCLRLREDVADPDGMIRERVSDDPLQSVRRHVEDGPHAPGALHALQEHDEFRANCGEVIRSTKASHTVISS